MSDKARLIKEFIIVMILLITVIGLLLYGASSVWFFMEMMGYET